MGKASKIHKQCIDCVLMGTRIHTLTHTQQRTAPPTHTCTHAYTHMYLHMDKNLPDVYIYYTHLHHTNPHLSHRYIRNAAHTHIHGTHLRIHIHTYTHTHTHTYTLTARSFTCKNTLTLTCTRTHTHTQEDGIYRESPVIRSMWGEGLILACEATCSRPIHPQ